MTHYLSLARFVSIIAEVPHLSSSSKNVGILKMTAQRITDNIYFIKLIRVEMLDFPLLGNDVWGF